MTTNNRTTRRASRVFWVGLLAAMLGACGDQNLFESMADDNSTTAEIESAKIAIDSGNFDDAIATLEGLCGTSPTAPTCDGETASLFASAYAGRAGVNVFDLIENSVNLTSGATLGSLATFSTLLPSPSTRDKSDLDDAVELLGSLAAPTANQNLQLSIYAMANAVVTVGVDLTGGFNGITGLPNVVPDVTTIQNAQVTNQTLDEVASALDLAIQGLDASGLGTEDLKSDIEALETAIDADGNGVVSAAEMNSFLATL
ncbi:MAG: hypothetical protein ACOYXU_01185 [Nitrospirota bacterium]